LRSSGGEGPIAAASDQPDFEAAGLLEGLEGRAREARQRLLAQLHESGASLEELREAIENDRLVILPAERALGGDARYTAPEIAVKANLPLEFFQAMLRACGLAVVDADERAYDDDDLEAARLIARFHSIGLDEQGMLEVGRVLGRGMAQTADAMGGLFGETFIKAGVTEEELGLRNAEAAREWLHEVTPLTGYLLRRHMRERLRHQARRRRCRQRRWGTGQRPRMPRTARHQFRRPALRHGGGPVPIRR
jgi:adenylate cyclase